MSAPNGPYDMDEATARLVVALELEEAQSLRHNPHGTADLAAAQQLHLDQLAEFRFLHAIQAMTVAEIAASETPESIICTSCEDRVATETAWQAPCEHWYCADCIEQLYRAAMVDESLYPPRCCVVLPWREVREQLPFVLAIRFIRKMAEFDTPHN